MIPRIFEGQKVFVVAGGPSLDGFDFSRLKGLNTIAINRAHEFLPDAKVLWWTDARYWRKAKASLLEHAAPYKATCQMEYSDEELPPEIHIYRFTGLEGFDPDPACLRHGNNSAYAGIHLAAHLGSNFIVPLGLDMRHGAGGKTHFHDGHDCPHLETTLTKLMAPYFDSLKKPLAALGIRVLNASPNSALKVWPRCSIEEGLAA